MAERRLLTPSNPVSYYLEKVSVYSPEEIRAWHFSVRPHLDRAAEKLTNALRDYVEDWSTTFGFRTQIFVPARVKSPERIWEKLHRKLDDAAFDLQSLDGLLVEDGPIGDLVATRIVCRSLSDVHSLEECLENNPFPFLIQDELRAVDNKNERPSVTGYRAIHLNLDVPSTVRTRTFSVPGEVQIKTLLQDSWGFFTHDSAYARRDLTSDARFDRIRQFQRMLADSIDVADRLNLEIERLQSEVIADMRITPLGDDVNHALLLQMAAEHLGTVPTLAEAQDLAVTAKSVGIHDRGGLTRIFEDRDRTERLGLDLEARLNRKPSVAELLSEMLTQPLIDNFETP